MRVLFALTFLLLSCRSTESACEDFCDKGEDCDSTLDEQACVDECIDDVADDDAASSECQDAFIELVDCTNTLTCTEWAADEVPEQCADEHKTFRSECFGE